MGLPDVVIAGAAKCGTTALAAALAAHPDFHLGKEKEPRYFTQMSATFVGPTAQGFNASLIRDTQAYWENFAGSGIKRTVDASTDYLNCTTSAQAIAAANPDALIIIGIRHPVRRAWSEHLHLKRVGAEQHSFEQALRREAERRAAGWAPLFGHVERSLYAEGIRSFIDVFGRNRVFVYRHEDLIRLPNETYLTLADFLQTSTPIEPPGKHNVGGIPKSRLLNHLVRSRSGLIKTVREALRDVVPLSIRLRIRDGIDRANLDRSDHPSAEASGWILKRAADDIAATEKLTGLDLAEYRLLPTR